MHFFNQYNGPQKLIAVCVLSQQPRPTSHCQELAFGYESICCSAEIRAIHDSKYDSGGRAHQPAVLDSQMFATQDGLLENDYALRDHHEAMDRAGSAELGKPCFAFLQTPLHHIYASAAST